MIVIIQQAHLDAIFKYSKFNKNFTTVFSNNDGEPLQAGNLLKQPQLAKVLTSVAKNGSKAFYEVVNGLS